ncbi:hypothetical protein K435DRAFT_813188, partial [Dendrothele bispora CBS 962.96]
MPSTLVSEVLLKLYFLDDTSAYPWCFSEWQRVTGVEHGLFPEDDRLLPKPWSRKDADDIYSFFMQYRQLPEASQQEKFFKGGRGEDECPGRDKWRSWVKKHWDKWEIHPIVIRCLQEADVHPISIMVAGDSLEWPNSTFCLPSATPELARALFGPEAFDDKGVLPAKFRQHLVSIGQRSWDRLRQRINNQKDRIHLLEESAMAAFTALNDNKLTVAKVARVIKLVSEWRDVAQIFGTKRNLEVADNMLAELDHTLEIA